MCRTRSTPTAAHAMALWTMYRDETGGISAALERPYAMNAHPSIAVSASPLRKGWADQQRRQDNRANTVTSAAPAPRAQRGWPNAGTPPSVVSQ